jgi:hypothetical protein
MSQKHSGMEIQKIKMIASQAQSINKFKNIKEKLMLYCASIYFNKQCLDKNITPNYAKCKIPHTSPAAKIKQQKTRKTRIKDEIRFLYRKKKHINTQLYKAHLQAANTWGPAWDIMSDTAHENIRHNMTRKYHSLDQKLQNLRKINGLKNNTDGNIETNTKFYPRVINLTNIKFNDDENKLLQKGLKYNLHLKPKQWIKTLALEA